MTSMTIQDATTGCPCGSTEAATEVFHTSTRRYVRCPACDLVFLQSRPARATVEQYYRETYDGEYGAAEASEDRQPVFQSVLKHLSSHRMPPGDLLDIGCGDGEFLLLCQRTGWTCYGIELSRQATVRAAQRGLTILPWQTLEQGEPRRQFDVVTLINVLETVADPWRMLLHVTDLVTPGGLVLIRASNGAFHLPMRVPARWIGSQYDQAFHWYVYTAKALARLLTSAGLHVVGLRNSRPSRGPLSPSHPWWSRMKWAASRTALWAFAQTMHYATNGRIVCAPSFEMIAQRPEHDK